MEKTDIWIKRIYVAFALLSAAALMACGRSEESPVSEDDIIIAESKNNTNTGEISASEEKRPETDDRDDNRYDENGGLSEDRAEYIEPTVPEILNFVDVFGEEYQVEIDQAVDKQEYVLSNYIRNGDNLSYEDEVYISRPGIDVSHHQGEIDWDKVAAQGFEFAILRVGYRGYGEEGIIKEDSKFEEYYIGAKQAGLDVGVYFFAQAINEDEAAEEAEFVLDVLSGRELELPVVYDPESILDAKARTDNVTAEQFTQNTAVFCDRIAAAGYSPMIYSNMLWEAYNLDLSKLDGIPIWYADYEELPQTPYMFEFWQYSNEGKVSGISGLCDLDIQMLRKTDIGEQGYVFAVLY